MKESLLILSLLFAQTTSAKSGQNLEAVKSAIIKYLSSSISNVHQQHKIIVDRIDPRLKLPECAQPLTVFAHKGKIKLGRNSIGVSCKGKQPWNIFHTATISAYEKIVVLNQAVQRGEILTPQHVRLENREISRLRSGFFTDFNQVINKQAKRNFSSGKVLTVKNLTEPNLIKRGQKITIAATSPGFTIEMSGLAMQNGIKGQRIAVKNENSNRIIQATVIQPGLVNVNFAGN
jgi:flagella basal body P-ring formation protein FlgA